MNDPRASDHAHPRARPGAGGTNGGPPGNLDVSKEVARHVSVSGRVQGVFFRATTRQEARRHDVFGWVRNARDGRVEAHLQGTAADVETVLDWMRAGGPSAARVRDVEVVEAAPVDLDDFEIRH